MFQRYIGEFDLHLEVLIHEKGAQYGSTIDSKHRSNDSLLHNVYRCNSNLISPSPRTGTMYKVRVNNCDAAVSRLQH